MMTTTLPVELDRSSPVPLYFQLAQAFEKAIIDGGWRALKEIMPVEGSK